MKQSAVFLVLAAVAGLATAAHAGDICGDDRRIDLKALEQYAARTFTGDPMTVKIATMCLANDAPHADRIVAACTKVLDREPSFTGCFTLVAYLGRVTAGKHDVFAWAAKLPLDPWDVNSSMMEYPLYVFQKMGDARAVPLIVGMWRASIPRAAQKEKRHRGDDMSDWSGWRQHAAETLGMLGGVDEIAFLDEQAKATVDVHVAEACTGAIAAIRKRLAK